MAALNQHFELHTASETSDEWNSELAKSWRLMATDPKSVKKHLAWLKVNDAVVNRVYLELDNMDIRDDQQDRTAVLYLARLLYQSSMTPETSSQP